MDAPNAREIIVQAVAEDDARTMRELAELAGCSRQRVHQILKAEGLKLKDYFAMRALRDPPAVEPRIVVSGAAVPISHSTGGTIAELLAAADLMARGWFVYYPLIRNRGCDLVAVSKDRLRVRRIEVRSGRRQGNGESLLFNKRPDDACDHHAVVLPREPIRFVPDIESGC